MHANSNDDNFFFHQLFSTFILCRPTVRRWQARKEVACWILETSPWRYKLWMPKTLGKVRLMLTIILRILIYNRKCDCGLSLFSSCAHCMSPRWLIFFRFRTSCACWPVNCGCREGQGQACCEETCRQAGSGWGQEAQHRAQQRGRG